MITYQQEFLQTCEHECQDLIALHWDEIAANKSIIKLNPDWEAYRELEGRSALKIFTVRNDGSLVGYFVVIVGRNLHYKDHIFAENDVIYLHPDFRKGLTGVKLIKFAQKCLMEDDVSVLKINTKVDKPFDTIMNWLGFDLSERVYIKYLKGN